MSLCTNIHSKEDKEEQEDKPEEEAYSVASSISSFSCVSLSGSEERVHDITFSGVQEGEFVDMDLTSKVVDWIWQE